MKSAVHLSVNFNISGKERSGLYRTTLEHDTWFHGMPGTEASEWHLGNVYIGNTTN